MRSLLCSFYTLLILILIMSVPMAMTATVTIVAMIIAAFVAAVIMPVITVSVVMTIADDHLVPTTTVLPISRPYISIVRPWTGLI